MRQELLLQYSSGLEEQASIDRFAWETTHALIIGEVVLSQPAICSGDQFACNFRATIRRSRAKLAQVCRSWGGAFVSKLVHLLLQLYTRAAHHFLEISRDTVDAGRINRPAMDRRDTLADKPREISSLSVRVSARGLRRCLGCGIPPCEWKKRYTAHRRVPSARLISLGDSPALHRFQSSARSLEAQTPIQC